MESRRCPRGVEGAGRGAGRPCRHLGGASQHGLRSIVDGMNDEDFDVVIRVIETWSWSWTWSWANVFSPWVPRYGVA